MGERETETADGNLTRTHYVLDANNRHPTTSARTIREACSARYFGRGFQHRPADFEQATITD